MDKIIITAADGYRLSALFGKPVSAVNGTIILSAAAGVKKEFYLNFARFLINHGYRVLLYDYRGIGESAPVSLKASTIYIHEWGTHDMNAVLDYLVDEGYSGIIWLGHSIGAQLVGLLKNKEYVQKVISKG